MDDKIINEAREAVDQLVAGDLDAWITFTNDRKASPRLRAALWALGEFILDMNAKNAGRNHKLASLEERAVGWPDLDLEVDERGRPALKLAKGTTVIRQRIGLNDQGIWRAGAVYYKGDVVSHARSLWFATNDRPSGKPGDASSGWRLAVMHGRDGKDGKDAPGPTEDAA